jgi:hypothetical protein
MRREQFYDFGFYFIVEDGILGIWVGGNEDVRVLGYRVYGFGKTIDAD